MFESVGNLGDIKRTINKMFRPEGRDWLVWFTGLCDGEASFSYQTKWPEQRLNPKFSILPARGRFDDL